ncbi:MAG: ATP-binding protein [Candidatus Riflebacteria bacterium]|nr:ATP-binding protein [Candidatus Riflebacteria bacterium]
MKTIRNACKLQSNALEINVGDQIEQLDQIIHDTDGSEYFGKTFITEGMKILLIKGVARLAGKSNDTVFHLKQAMGGGKTHLMVGFGLLAKDANLRNQKIGELPHQGSFSSAKIAAFNGRNNPDTYLWGEIARQLGKASLFKEYWESGAKAPDEGAWVKLFEGKEPILILLDEMPPYFHYYTTQVLGQGTIADVITRAFSNMLTAASKKKNVCIVVSDLEAAYDTGGKLIQKALDDATQELGRAEINITPVNLETNEIYEIIRKRLFVNLPDISEIADIASVYASRLAEAAKAKSVDRSAESLANEIEMTYPFHPSFKSIVALFKENEKFKQTRGLMELVSRLLKSVWQSDEDIYLIGAQHFDLSIHEVREKLADISEMRDVIAKDLWDSTQSAHAQIIDIASGNQYAKQVGTLLLTASLSTAINSVKGLLESEMLECLIDPNNQASEFKKAFLALEKTAWYLHQTQEGRSYFDHQENLTKKLQGYAEKAPQNKVDELIRHRLVEMYTPTTKEAYEKVLPLPEMDEAAAALKTYRTMLIISPDGKVPPEVVKQFYSHIPNKNNLLVLTGEKSLMANLEKSARHVYAATKADNELPATHPQRAELDERKAQYAQDFQATILNVFDKILFPGMQQNEDILRAKALDSTYPSNESYNGEKQVIKTLVSDPIKLYTQVAENFDTLRTRAEQLLFGSSSDARKTDLIDKLRQKTQMPWLPVKGFDLLIQEACQRGVWEDIGNGYITKKPRPKTTQVVLNEESSPDDTGAVRLKVDAVNSGNAPRIHYQEDGTVSANSPVLSESVLTTRALRVQFLAVDPSGKNLTGNPVTWTNHLIIRNKFEENTRKLEILVAPCGTIRYTLDGSEARNGMNYSQPLFLNESAQFVYVFAECDGIEEKRTFQFAAKGKQEIEIKKDKPAQIISSKPKRLENSAKTYEGLRLAKEKGITFEEVMLLIGSSPKVIHLSLGEMPIQADFLEKELANLQSLLTPDAPVILSFKKAYISTGFDLEQFTKALGIELKIGEVIQE